MYLCFVIFFIICPAYFVCIVSCLVRRFLHQMWLILGGVLIAVIVITIGKFYSEACFYLFGFHLYYKQNKSPRVLLGSARFQSTIVIRIELIDILFQCG